MQRVFIIHGWSGYPEEAWMSWLRKELEARGFSVQAPSMPFPDEPNIEKWTKHLARIVGEVDENTYFVGHSIGCQTILRYLETLQPNEKIGGAVFVAGWFTLQNLETQEEKDIAEPWLNRKIDFVKVKLHTTKFITILSDNDPVVNYEENKRLFEKNLSAKIITEHNKDHLGADSGVKELLSALQSILELAKKKV
jgi:hypothetical protein